MKITKARLRQIIKEEIENSLKEGPVTPTKYVSPRRRMQQKQQRSAAETSPRISARGTYDLPVGRGGDLREESRRLFDHFFGQYDEYALEVIMRQDEELEDIITHLYGWALPQVRGYRELGPSADVVAIAQQFEVEDKEIVDNEEEFYTRLEALQFKRGKEQFASARAHGAANPARGVKVPKAATPGTPEYKEFEKLSKVAPPPKRRRWEFP